VEIPKPNRFQTLLLSKASLFKFIRSYNVAHPGFDKSFGPSESVLNEFRSFLANDKVEYEEADFMANLDFIKRQLRYEYVLGTLARRPQKALEGDEQVNKAEGSPLRLVPERQESGQQEQPQPRLLRNKKACRQNACRLFVDAMTALGLIRNVLKTPQHRQNFALDFHETAKLPLFGPCKS
jgi:hypothetical protein